MFKVNWKCMIRLITLISSMSLLSGCYSLDQNKFCPFGKRSSQETDYSAPIIIDANNDKISRGEQKSLLKSADLFSAKIINDTYNAAETLCANDGLTTEQYQILLNTSNKYIKSGAVYPWTWTTNGKQERNKLYLALEANNGGYIITQTLCVVGICSKKDHEAFCKNHERPYLNNKKLSDSLTSFYIGNKGYKTTYPKTKSTSYCKAPQW